MFTRRHLILSAGALAGCTTMPQENRISDDDYALYNLLWRDLECREKNGFDLIVTETLNITQRARPQSGLQSIINKYKNKIFDETLDDFYAVNKQSYPIDITRISTNCARFVSNAEAAEIEPTLEARTILDKEREEMQRRIREYIETGEIPPMTEKQQKLLADIERVMADARERGDDPEAARRNYLDSRPKTVPYPTLRAVTRFGFDKSRRQAIGATDEYCGSLCAVKELVIAERQNHGWVITDKEWYYIS